MITDINHKTIISALNRTKLPSYWTKYFEYESDYELYNLTRNELINEIEEEKKKARPYIDSKIVISLILTRFGVKHIFHRKFCEKHPDSDRGQVLGMQLYHIMLNETDVWVYCDTKKNGHLFSHATYFK